MRVQQWWALPHAVTPPINKYKPSNAFEYNQRMKEVIGERNREHLILQQDQNFTTALKEFELNQQEGHILV